MNNYNCISKCDEIINTDNRENGTSDLGELRDLMIWICQKLYAKQIFINHKYGKQFKGEGSSISENTSTGEKVIWLNLSDASGRDLLWILIHEYDHALLGMAPKGKIKTRGWELKVWDKGWESVIIEFPILERYGGEFIKRRNMDAVTYPDWNCVDE